MYYSFNYHEFDIAKQLTSLLISHAVARYAYNILRSLFYQSIENLTKLHELKRFSLFSPKFIFHRRKFSLIPSSPLQEIVSVKMNFDEIHVRRKWKVPTETGRDRGNQKKITSNISPISSSLFVRLIWATSHSNHHIKLNQKPLAVSSRNWVLISKTFFSWKIRLFFNQILSVVSLFSI
jgi:hypothetical protein